jgi:hypothetical protein
VTDARIKELKAELEALEGKKPALTIKFGNKRNVVVGGPGLKQRFPVTLYAPSWLILLDHADEIRQFIEDHKDELSWDRE